MVTIRVPFLILLIGITFSSCNKKRVVKIDLKGYSPPEETSSSEHSPRAVAKVVSAITATSVEPLEILPYSEVIFDIPHPPPEPENEAYRELVAKWDKEAQVRNGKNHPKGRRDAVVNSIVLTIEEGDNGVYDNYNRADDIKTLTINAREVTLNATLLLPGSDLVINAQTLTIESGASVDITPYSFVRGDRPRELGQNGQYGENAGKIVLNIANLVNHNTTWEVFIARGGRGQDGGLGRDGHPGKNVKDINGKGLIYHHDANKPLDAYLLGPVIVLGDDKHYSLPNYSKPGNGGNAVAGGRPGDGGNGGVILTNVSLPHFSYNLSPGSPGDKAPDYRGGDPGKPSNAHAIHYYKKYSEMNCQNPCPSQKFGIENYDSFDMAICMGEGLSPTCYVNVLKEREKRTVKHHAIVGKGAKSPQGDSGQFGQTQVVNPEERQKPWATIAYTRMLQKFGEDSYLSGHFYLANEYYRESLEILQSHGVVEGQGQLLLLNAQLQLQQLNSGLNYFGQGAGYVPAYSSHLEYETFKEEVEVAIETLNLVRRIERENPENRAALMETLGGLIEKKIEVKWKGLRDMANEVSLLMKKEQLVREEESSRIREFFNTLANDGDALELVKMSPLNLLGSASNTPDGGWVAMASGAEFIDRTPEQVESLDLISRLIGHAIPVHTPTYMDGGFPSFDEIGLVGQEYYIPPRDFTRGNALLTEDFSPVESAGAIDFAIDELQREFLRWRQGKVPLSTLQEQLQECREVVPFMNELAINRLFQERLKFTRSANNFVLQFARGLYSTNRYHYIKEAISDIEEENSIPVELADLQRIAKRVLLKYYYYAVKIYQYNLLTPFQETFPWEDMLQRAENREDENGEDWRNAFVEIYLGELEDILEKAFLYPGSGGLKSVAHSFNLLDEEVVELNHGQVVYLDLTRLGIFKKHMEDIRAKNFQLTAEVDSIGEQRGEEDVKYTLRLAHVGHFYIQRSGKQYYFELNDKIDDKMAWEIHGQGPSGVDEHRLSPSPRNSFFQTVLDRRPERGIILPPIPLVGAVTDVALELDKWGDDGDKFELKDVGITIDYQYREAKSL